MSWIGLRMTIKAHAQRRDKSFPELPSFQFCQFLHFVSMYPEIYFTGLNCQKITPISNLI